VEGHKVLIFSQFKLVLDLLQDMCADAGWPAERLDGDTSAAERQAGIDRFNDAAGGGFVYLLSTRAGGMGITLTAADTAVIFDSDWNPQADLQAMARCHRIGQTKAVRVYRLITRGTYEEAILKSASRKYGLDEALLGGDAAGAAEDPLADVARIEGLLKHGVMAFSEQAVAETARFCAEGIDDILSTRAERRQVGSRKGNTFSTATFVVDEAAPPSADEPPADLPQKDDLVLEQLQSQPLQSLRSDRADYGQPSDVRVDAFVAVERVAVPVAKDLLA
jgi:chromodomain-helicase-DNA-binding protein 7